MIRPLLIITLLAFTCCAYAQDDLLQLLDDNGPDQGPQYATATFKGSRLVNGHSVEMRKAGVLEFLISHRFGRLNSGASELFGLDNANIRFALEYGFNERFNVGIGRSSFEKTFDGFVKYKFLRQTAGSNKTPISLVYFASIAINSLENTDPNVTVDFSSRLYYTHQVLIARKFSPAFSMQLMPTLVHRNEVEENDENDIYAIGVGGRYKLTNRLAINAEYYYRANQVDTDPNFNVIALGVDIETGGHVFQLHVTNGQAMVEKGFITETTGDFFSGDIHFGFNISRVFNLK